MDDVKKDKSFKQVLKEMKISIKEIIHFATSIWRYGISRRTRYRIKYFFMLAITLLFSLECAFLYYKAIGFEATIIYLLTVLIVLVWMR